MNAIPICSNIYNQTNAYSGVGTIAELNATNQGCLSTGENNSTWYIFTTSTAGNLVFTLTPNVTSDYDIAVWDLTDNSCAVMAQVFCPSDVTMPPWQILAQADLQGFLRQYSCLLLVRVVVLLAVQLVQWLDKLLCCWSIILLAMQQVIT